MSLRRAPQFHLPVHMFGSILDPRIRFDPGADSKLLLVRLMSGTETRRWYVPVNHIWRVVLIKYKSASIQEVNGRVNWAGVGGWDYTFFDDTGALQEYTEYVNHDPDQGRLDDFLLVGRELEESWIEVVQAGVPGLISMVIEETVVEDAGDGTVIP